jgi:hypothetical protein
MIYNELFCTSMQMIEKIIKKIKKYFLFFVILSMTFFSSCKKNFESDSVIKISSPLSGEYFNAGDTIHVMADISNDNQLTSVTVRLLNTAYIAAGPDYTFPVSANSYSLNFQYIIDNIYLETGNYLVDVIASDGQHQTNAYVSIHINELPKERKAIYILSAIDSFSFHVSKLDSLNNPISIINVTGDYSGSAIYSINHELFTIGKYTGSFNAFDLNNNSQLWQKPALHLPISTFQNLVFSDDIIYASYYDGNIKGYDKNGSQKFAVQQQGFFIPDKIYKNDNYFFSEIYYPSIQQNKIGVFYLVTGAPRQEATVDLHLKNMYTLDQNRLLLFGNDLLNGQGKIEVYNISGNGTTSIHTIPTGSLNNVVQVDNTHYFISHSEGIYLYDYSLNSLTPFVSGLPVYSLEYDDIDQELFSCSGNQVQVYNSVTAGFQYTITNVDSVMDVKVLYNK